MKSCPFCAELIQEAAVKCRFCGEWLDPSRRPSWALTAGSADPQRVTLPAVTAPTATTYTRPASPGRSGITTTTVMGSAPPARPGVPSPSSTLGPGWSPPAWMSAEDGSPVPPPFERRTAEQTLVEALSPEQVSAAIAQANRQSAPSFQARPPRPAAPSPYDIGGTASEVVAEPKPEPVAPPRELQEAEPVQRTTLDEVSHRMQRIKASAVAVRQAVQEETRRNEGRPQDAAAASSGTRTRTAPAAVAADDRPPPNDDMEAAEDEEDDDGFGDEDDEEDFGLDDEEDGEHGSLDDDFADLGAPPRPAYRSWIPFLAAAALAAGVGGYVLAPYLSAALFGDAASSGPVDAADAAPVESPAPAPGDPSGDVRPGSIAPAAQAPEGGVPVEPAAGPQAAPDAVDVAPGETQVAARKSVTSQLAQNPSTPSTADPATQEILTQARRLLHRGGEKQLAEAQALLETTLSQQPKLAEAMVVLAVVQLEQGNPDASRTTATRCTKVAPQEGSCWLVLGALSEEAYLDREQPDEDRTLHKLSAIASYQQYVDLDPEGRYADDATKAIQRLK